MKTSNWLYAGLFLVTFSTLLLELLDSRLLSVLTWYHLSFLAVSLAMLGMAAGAVYVFQAGEALEGEAATRRLSWLAGGTAIATLVSHLINLCIPIPSLNRFETMEVVAIAIATTVLAIPFCLSGVTVTVALTRAGGSIGRLYGCDLAGAALACLVVVPLLDSSRFNVTSLVFVAAGTAAAGGWCFARFVGARGTAIATLAGACLVAALINGARVGGIEVAYPKNRQLWAAATTFEQVRWNSHSYVIVQRPVQENVFLWGPGRATPDVKASIAWLAIDGEAGTPITKWDGDPRSIAWVRHDVTALPYHLRHGAAAVIGVGGGRDILSAIATGNESIVGIDVNRVMIDLLTGTHRSFAGVADRPGVRLVHDDARAFLTRSAERFDVIQMSLIDTWAATGAGAFTLSENGLYTIEAWQMLLSRLKSTGVFSVSRWFSPQNISETNRLLALGVGALLQLGIRKPVDHILLVSRGGIATLIISASQFTVADDATIRRIVEEEEFTIHVSPWTGGSNARLDRIARSQTAAELDLATADPHFDYRPPTDQRPFFFNMLRPTSFMRVYSLPRGGVLWGNMRATATLVLLFFIAGTLVLMIILWPLMAAGRPPMRASVFLPSLWYFAAIGLGFMLVQVAFLQRFSIYLGHPMYTFAVTLFSMILFAGVGSYLSDRVAPRKRTTQFGLPIGASVAIILGAVFVQSLTDSTIQWGLAGRAAIVCAMLAPIATVLGFFFPTGLQLVARISPRTTAWMWGVNGAFGVLGSIAAVGISMWVGIQANLFFAAILYASLIWPLRRLQSEATRAEAVEDAVIETHWLPDSVTSRS